MTLLKKLQKKIKQSESDLTKGGIEKKEGAGKGQNQNVELVQNTLKAKRGEIYGVKTCLLYTSDAADE